MADGLYTMNFEFKDGSTGNGWFILSDLTSSASPTVESPAVGETFDIGNPELRWMDFKSPEYKSAERRTLSLSISAINANRATWEYYIGDPTMTHATVGSEPGGTGAKVLSDGKYWGVVSYHESRVFGPMRLVRVSRTGRQFYVKTQ